MSARVVIRVNAGVVLAVGTALLVPLMISWLYGDGSWRSFLLPGAAMIALGGVGVLVTRPHLAIIVASVFFVGCARLRGRLRSLLRQAFRDSAFTVTSIITTTGFVTADFDQWDTGATTTLVLLMFVGGCAGSTAGGIKVIRILIVFRTIFQDIFRMVHPRAVTPLKMGDRILPEGVRVAVLGLFAAWVVVFVLATFLVAIQQDLSPFSSATAVAATLNVVGPGLGQVGASESFEAVNAFGRFVLTLCMLFGRLEIFTALAVLSPAFWKK